MKKRAFWIILAATTLSLSFWITSRYPDLDSKALMAEQGTVADTISAFPIFTISPSDPVWKKIAYTTVNWANDNKKGMAYGILMAALLFTLMGYIRFDRIRSRWWEKVAGLMIGAPLGLCVNCAAPVFKGMLRSKRLDMSFTAMFSSPTLNIVVLTMVFTLFPFYMGLVKVGFTLVTIFFVVPLLRRTALSEEKVKDFSLPELAAEPTETQATPPEPWHFALWNAFKDFLKNLWLMVRRTVPLMLLAGFLGAVLSHLIPLETITAKENFITLAITAFVGVFLPVPMAFDIILTHALYQQGLPIGVVLILLCTLGIFSVYSFSIVWTSTSPRWATSLFAAFCVMGLIVGLMAAPMHRMFHTDENMNEFASLRAKAHKVAINKDAPAQDKVVTTTNPIQLEPYMKNEAVSVARFAYNKKAQTGSKPFIKHEGSAWGLDKGFRFRIVDYPDPFWIGRGTAAGDFNRDGWMDLAFGSEEGLVLYQNNGGRFVLVDHGQAWLKNLNVYAVAFVDFSNDGSPDLFFSTFKEGNFIIKNTDGQLDFANPVKVPNHKGIITVSPAFADLNRNGFIDIYNGNMALGVVTGSHDYRQGRENSIVYNNGNYQFSEVALDGASGESMSTLISDFNNDGFLDVYVGEDFIVPDKIFLGQKSGRFYQVRASDNFIDKTPVFSMGGDTGDFNNDGVLDFIVSGTTSTHRFVGKDSIDGVEPARYAMGKWQDEVCDGIQGEDMRQHCRIVRASKFLGDGHSSRNIKVSECRKLNGETQVQDCLVAAMWTLITRDGLAENCTTQFANEPKLMEVCQILKKRRDRYPAALFQRSIKQENKSFVYQGTPGGKLVDINSGDPNQTAYKHPGGWTWNTKFADLDGDGWLDIFNSEGAVRVNEFGWNVFMKNIEGKRFEQKQFSYNLVDDFSLFSFTLADFDWDGDIDIVGNSSAGPVQIYENTSAANSNNISFALEDPSKGNRFAIGAKIRIIEQDSGRKQLREIKASGGYQSFDPPVAYFGLGKSPGVKTIAVTWPDGKTDEIQGAFAAGHHYVISRQ